MLYCHSHGLENQKIFIFKTEKQERRKRKKNIIINVIRTLILITHDIQFILELSLRTKELNNNMYLLDEQLDDT